MSRQEKNQPFNNPEVNIPESTSMEGWKDVPIVESSQPLIHLNPLENDLPIIILPKYYINGIQNASQDLYLREEAAKKLIAACALLPQNYSLVIFDSYRPLDVQQEIFDNFKLVLKANYPDKTDFELTQLTEVYVSIPSSDPLKPSPHATGGAIDLSIADNNGKLLDMGTEWDSFEIESQTKYFRDRNDLYHQNRLLLYRIMATAEFTNYPEEWWHYDFGNQFWGHISKKEAIYGLIEGGDIHDRNRQS